MWWKSERRLSVLTPNQNPAFGISSWYWFLPFLAGEESMASFGSLKSAIFDREERKQYVFLSPHSLFFDNPNLSIFAITGNIRHIFEASMHTIATKNSLTIMVLHYPFLFKLWINPVLLSWNVKEWWDKASFRNFGELVIVSDNIFLMVLTLTSFIMYCQEMLDYLFQIILDFLMFQMMLL